MLEDGEYDIDILALLAPSEDNRTRSDTTNASNRLWGTTNGTVAIRYGFIPDAMNQKGPLTLYLNEHEWFLQATSSDRKPLIFEGLEQQRMGDGNSEDSYYLVYDPSNTRKQMQLKPLGNAIRFNKSRNVQRLEKRIQKWHEDVNGESSDEHTVSKPQRLLKSPSKIQQEGTRSLKRPPVTTESNIISESDFEDLADGDSFPVFEVTDLAKEEPEPSKTKIITEPEPAKTKIITEPEPAKTKINTEPKPRKTVAKKLKPKSKKKDSIEDDFQDLEDQLAEVLHDDDVDDEDEEVTAESNSGHENTNSTLEANGISHDFDSDSDSDSDEDDEDSNSGSYNNMPASVLLINDSDDEKPATKTPSAFDGAFDSAKKPMSLRQLIGGSNGQDDDDNLSMSEEE